MNNIQSAEKYLERLESRTPLGAILVRAGKLKSKDLERALAAQIDSPGVLIGQILVKLGLVSESDVLAALSEQFGLPAVGIDSLPVVPAEIPGLDMSFWRVNQAYPIVAEPDRVVVALAYPHDPFVAKSVRLVLGRWPDLCIVSEMELERALAGAVTESEEAEKESVDQSDAAEFIEHLRDMASEAPVIRRVSQIIGRVVELRASDIHLEPFEDGLHVRYRIDGEIGTHELIPLGMAPAVISRVKLMAHLDIAERRLPQDGRIRARVKGHELDLRVSTIPTVHGESVVLRVLDNSSMRLDLAEMGFVDDTLKSFLELIARPHGILLVTGPTGSGKTTTLYAALAKLDADAQKIITVEDPVEYQLPGINQIQVHAAINLTFARLLRSILRQDPDIIMIGEMRDAETAQIAVQAALTGHLVLSTLHTNTAAGAVIRLQDMGVERYLITSSVNGVLAQRLVRRLCAQCRQAYVPDLSLIRRLGMQGVFQEGQVFYRAAGCPACRGVGYVGRVAIHELLVLDGVIHRAIIDGADAVTLNALALERGMRSLRADGLLKAAQGLTTIEEVVRCTEDASDA